MSYYINRAVEMTFEQAVDKVKAELQKEGFGVLTEIDVKETLKKKLNVEFRKYRILGACNPPLAHRALQAEDRIGVMLPCNVIVQEMATGKVDIAAIDPTTAMQAIGNPKLAEIAAEVRGRLERVVKGV